VNYISVTWFFKMVVDQNQKARKEAVETFANTVPLSLSQVKIPREVLACMCVHVGISLSLSLSLSLRQRPNSPGWPQTYAPREGSQQRGLLWQK
jgi:hypothetical protein